MCWFAGWVTVLSARCKYKMISAQQAKRNNYKNTKLKLLKTNAGISNEILIKVILAMN